MLTKAACVFIKNTVNQCWNRISLIPIPNFKCVAILPVHPYIYFSVHSYLYRLTCLYLLWTSTILLPDQWCQVQLTAGWKISDDLEGQKLTKASTFVKILTKACLFLPVLTPYLSVSLQSTSSCSRLSGWSGSSRLKPSRPSLSWWG